MRANGGRRDGMGRPFKTNILLTPVPLAHKMEAQSNGAQGRDPKRRLLCIETVAQDAEGANLERANPGETLRQKDPASI
jgi:hypothetical protein